MKRSFLEGNKLKITLHVLAWAILLGLPFYFIKRWQIGKEFIWFYYINNLISGMIFYANYLVLVPSFFFRKKKYIYYLSVLCLIVSFSFVSSFSNKRIFKFEQRKEEARRITHPAEMNRLPVEADRANSRLPMREMHIFNYTFTSLILVLFSLGIRILERHSQIEKLQEKLEKERLNSELAFLKNQISPHFFFNTLNNIYSLISINNDDAQKAVLKLSKLMRYLLYESEQGNTTLKNELDFMTNYIDLMKLRMNDKVSLKVSFPENYEEISIPPLIFIPFIENAFKHGISYRGKSFIEISLAALKNSISFRCVNSIVKTEERSDSNNSGIGLENARKRLALLFPDRHKLKIFKSDKEFEILLQINVES